MNQIAKLKREAWISRVEREAFVKKAIENNEIPSVSNISKAMDLPTTIVTKEVVDLCGNIETKVFNIPIQHSIDVEKFNKEVHPVNSKTKKTPGCYIIYNEDDSTIGSYVGQSTNLNARIKGHAKGTQKATSDIIKVKNCKVKIYFVDIKILPNYITMKDFINILEQYLFIKEKPTLNISLVACSGYSSLDMINSPKHIEKVSQPLHVY